MPRMNTNKYRFSQNPTGLKYPGRGLSLSRGGGGGREKLQIMYHDKRWREKS